MTVLISWILHTTLYIVCLNPGNDHLPIDSRRPAIRAYAGNSNHRSSQPINFWRSRILHKGYTCKEESRGRL